MLQQNMILMTKMTGKGGKRYEYNCTEFARQPSYVNSFALQLGSLLNNKFPATSLHLASIPLRLSPPRAEKSCFPASPYARQHEHDGSVSNSVPKEPVLHHLECFFRNLGGVYICHY